MPQALLPMIPDGATPISDRVSVVRQNEQWTYLVGLQPVFEHPADDRKAFRMFTAQLCGLGACTQAQIIRVFGVSKKSVIRSVQKFREEGTEGFYRPRRGRGGSVLTTEVTAHAQQLLDQGRPRREVAKELGVQYDTLRKAIEHGRLREPTPPSSQPVSRPPTASSSSAVPSDKSSRSEADAAAGAEMGVACTRPCERVLAAIGMLPGGAIMKFQPCRDVSYGGCCVRCRPWPPTGSSTIWKPCPCCRATT